MGSLSTASPLQNPQAGTKEAPRVLRAKNILPGAIALLTILGLALSACSPSTPQPTFFESTPASIAAPNTRGLVDNSPNPVRAQVIETVKSVEEVVELSKNDPQAVSTYCTLLSLNALKNPSNGVPDSNENSEPCVACAYFEGTKFAFDALKKMKEQGLTSTPAYNDAASYLIDSLYAIEQYRASQNGRITDPNMDQEIQNIFAWVGQDQNMNAALSAKLEKVQGRIDDISIMEEYTHNMMNEALLRQKFQRLYYSNFSSWDSNQREQAYKDWKESELWKIMLQYKDDSRVVQQLAGREPSEENLPQAILNAFRTNALAYGVIENPDSITMSELETILLVQDRSLSENGSVLNGGKLTMVKEKVREAIYYTLREAHKQGATNLADFLPWENLKTLTASQLAVEIDKINKDPVKKQNVLNLFAAYLDPTIIGRKYTGDFWQLKGWEGEDAFVNFAAELIANVYVDRFREMRELRVDKITYDLGVGRDDAGNEIRLTQELNNAIDFATFVAMNPLSSSDLNNLTARGMQRYESQGGRNPIRSTNVVLKDGRSFNYSFKKNEVPLILVATAPYDGGIKKVVIANIWTAIFTAQDNEIIPAILTLDAETGKQKLTLPQGYENYKDKGILPTMPILGVEAYDGLTLRPIGAVVKHDFLKSQEEAGFLEFLNKTIVDYISKTNINAKIARLLTPLTENEPVRVVVFDDTYQQVTPNNFINDPVGNIQELTANYIYKDHPELSTIEVFGTVPVLDNRILKINGQSYQLILRGDNKIFAVALDNKYVSLEPYDESAGTDVLLTGLNLGLLAAPRLVGIPAEAIGAGLFLTLFDARTTVE